MYIINCVLSWKSFSRPVPLETIAVKIFRIFDLISLTAFSESLLSSVLLLVNFPLLSLILSEVFVLVSSDSYVSPSDIEMLGLSKIPVPGLNDLDLVGWHYKSNLVIRRFQFVGFCGSRIVLQHDYWGYSPWYELLFIILSAYLLFKLIFFCKGHVSTVGMDTRKA